VVESLLERGVAGQLAVSVRDPARAGSIQHRGVDVWRGDFEDEASLIPAFSGVDRLLIISTDGDNATRIRQHKTAVRAAQAAGVGWIAYTSIVNADHNSLGLAEVHRATEEGHSRHRDPRMPFAQQLVSGERDGFLCRRP